MYFHLYYMKINLLKYHVLCCNIIFSICTLYFISDKKQEDITKHDDITIEEEKKINLGNGIEIKQSAFEMAFTCNDPSKFVITLSYSIWGYDTLANRCVKQMASKETRTPLTPEKV